MDKRGKQIANQDIKSNAPLPNMEPDPAHYDAIVLGAGIAGSVCALTLARQGWNVLVLEQRADPEYYKRVCTHILHPPAVRVLRSLDLLDNLQRKSAQATCMQIHYQDQTLFFPLRGKADAANIERKDLDPALKQALQSEPRIELKLGSQLYGYAHLSNQRHQLTVNYQGEDLSVTSHTLILADGRNSALASHFGARKKHTTNTRVALFAYVKENQNSETGPDDLTRKDSRVWSVNAGDEYIACFPNRKRNLVSWYFSEQKYAEIREEKEHLFEQQIDFLRQQGIDLGERDSPVMSAKHTAPVSATLPFSASMQGIYLVGDAKLAADPLTGVGCSWAMESAQLLAHCLGSSNTSHQAPTKTSRFATHCRYQLAHWIRFSAPSSLMSLVSNHGRWVFNSPVYRLLAKVSAPGDQRENTRAMAS